MLTRKVHGSGCCLWYFKIEEAQIRLFKCLLLRDRLNTVGIEQVSESKGGVPRYAKAYKPVQDAFILL